VLLAGGVGTRVGGDVPKQLIEVAGRPLMAHTLAAFDDHPAVDDVVVMMAPGHLDAVRALVRDGGYTKVRDVLEGAGTRSETTMRALAALGEQDRKVLLHDAVRPLVTPRIIGACLEALDRYAAVVVAVPSSDTVIEVGADETVRAVPPRGDLRRVQTPQGFCLSVIRRAYALARQDPGFEATDDCSVVVRYLPDVPVRVIPGDERNIKITRPVDVDIAERLFERAAERS
jgi:ribitol-5-phosphate 2-dehydrogenase (NADP+) / D-ribitol-5-phosphate cytidylyltransferase